MSYSQYSGNPYQSAPAQESGGYGNPYGTPNPYEGTVCWRPLIHRKDATEDEMPCKNGRAGRELID